jgi:hypothetical protein
MPPVFGRAATYASIRDKKKLDGSNNDVPGDMFADSHESPQELELRVGHVLSTCPFVQTDRMIKLVPRKEIVDD